MDGDDDIDGSVIVIDGNDGIVGYVMITLGIVIVISMMIVMMIMIIVMMVKLMIVMMFVILPRGPASLNEVAIVFRVRDGVGTSAIVVFVIVFVIVFSVVIVIVYAFAFASMLFPFRHSPLGKIFLDITFNDAFLIIEVEAEAIMRAPKTVPDICVIMRIDVGAVICAIATAVICAIATAVFGDAYFMRGANFVGRHFPRRRSPFVHQAAIFRR